MNLLRELLNAVKGLLSKSDRIVNALQERCQGLQSQVESLKALVESLRAEDAEEDALIAEALAEVEAIELPEVEENDESNPSQIVDEFIEEIVESPETDLTSEEVPTVGSEEETPEVEVETAIDSVISAIEDEGESEAA